eukprot:GEMP01022337.1.p1 GENE.GEMP01022337.1~~GEMP01022337.1.p1  ORF type:complete len:614 (+),score=123.08 GEMP01022337.1:170-2011(+)
MGQGQRGKLRHPPRPPGRSVATSSITAPTAENLALCIKCPGGNRLRDRYVVERNLGLGAFGVVDFARDKEPPHRAVAVKTFRADMQAQLSAQHGERIATRLWEEVTLQSRCRNRHVLQVIEWFGTDNKLEGFALEYCSGGSLKDRIETIERSGERLAEVVVARWMIHILSALEHVHAMNIIHRDVKLENFLVTCPEEDVLKLSDFGMAVAIEAGKVVKSRVGTPFYMAPEVIAGRSYNTKIDCWSAGVAFLYLLDAHTPLFNVDQLVSDVPPAVADIRWEDRGPSLEALRLLESLLTHSSQGRWSARRALSHPFLQNGLGSPRQEPPPTRSTTMASLPVVDLLSKSFTLWDSRKAFPGHFCQRSPSPSSSMRSPRASGTTEVEDRSSRHSQRVTGSSFRRGEESPRASGATENEERSLRPFVPSTPFRSRIGEESPRAQDDSTRSSCPSRQIMTKYPSAPNPRKIADAIGDGGDGDGGAPERGHEALVKDAEVKLAYEGDLAKIGLIIAMFDDRGDGRLNLQECQNMFVAANPSRINEIAYPDKKLYRKLAKSTEDGLSADEIYRLVSGSSEYIAKLYRKICKWRSMTEEEQIVKIAEKKRNSRRSKLGMDDG